MKHVKGWLPYIAAYVLVRSFERRRKRTREEGAP